MLDPQQPSNHHMLDGMVLTGLHMKLDAIIYVAPGSLNLLQCVQVSLHFKYKHVRLPCFSFILVIKGEQKLSSTRAIQHHALSAPINTPRTCI